MAYLKYILVVFFIPSLLFGQQNNIDQSLLNKFASGGLADVQTITDLANGISALTADKTEQLQLLLLWVDQNMQADAVAFFQYSPTLSTAEALKKRMGLCEEFSGIFDGFCKVLKIPSIRVEGYVRELGFQPNDAFTIGNHVWNAVYIDSAWLLCDLFWSTSVLKTGFNTSPHFEKTLNTEYYLASPEDFIGSHLPLDPIFQFEDHPVKMQAFTAVASGLDTTVERMPFCDYKDAINRLMKMPEKERKLRIAQNAYIYNKQNPNVLIVEYYNYAVQILNSRSAPKSILIKVKNYLTAALNLMDQSTDQKIKSLAVPCKKGIDVINSRLKAR